MTIEELQSIAVVIHELLATRNETTGFNLLDRRRNTCLFRGSICAIGSIAISGLCGRSGF